MEDVLDVYQRPYDPLRPIRHLELCGVALVPSFCAERQIQIKYGICHNLHGIHEFFLKSASRFLFPAHLFYHLFLLSEHLE